MLLVGETPCSAAATAAGMKCSVLPLAEQQTQMAIWSMASAPLLLSADLTNIPNESMAILTNPIALKINQDPQGRMPFRFISDSATGVDVWRKDLVRLHKTACLLNFLPFVPSLSWSLHDFSCESSKQTMFSQASGEVAVAIVNMGASAAALPPKAVRDALFPQQ